MKYTIPTYKQKTILKKLDDLNKRIAGMKGQFIDYTVSPSYQKLIAIHIEDNKTKDILVDVVDINVINPVVSLNGWSFLAVIEHSKEGNIILKKIYDVEVPEQYLTSDTYCEHCNTNRYRKYTYLVYKAETKEIHQVGSTCLTAYLGFDASMLLAHAELFITLGNLMNDSKEVSRMSKRGIEAQPIETFLKRSIAVINLHGYVSAKKAREKNMEGHDDIWTATGDVVWGFEYTSIKYWNNEFNESISDATKETYDKVIEWVNGLENTSDYIHNIKTIVARGYVTYKTATTAASIIGVWKKNHEQRKVEDKVVSNYVGTVKERIEVEVTVEHITIYEGTYGTNRCYKLRTNEGNILIWFTTNNSLELNEKYKGKCTITKHNLYNGICQTIVSRCKFNHIV